MNQTHDYIFVNGCDGSDLRNEETGLGRIDVEGSDLTEDEAKEKACELALRLASHGEYLVAACKVERDGFCVQFLDGEFVDRNAISIPMSELPELFRD